MSIQKAHSRLTEASRVNPATSQEGNHKSSHLPDDTDLRKASMSASTTWRVVALRISLKLYSTSQFLAVSTAEDIRSGESSRTQKGVRLDSGRSPTICMGSSATKP
mmetsp:Transcript_7966/g.14503  ORF Transcript_7966/g.14503 Transcript_7966/m.14503 type:complete len:106 (+) Transcript_7966:70-387(+)